MLSVFGGTTSQPIVHERAHSAQPAHPSQDNDDASRQRGQRGQHGPQSPNHRPGPGLRSEEDMDAPWEPIGEQPTLSFTNTTTTFHTTLNSTSPPAPPPFLVMERVLFQLHHRTCQFGLRYLSSKTRKLLEHIWLILAIGGFAALIVLHRQFVYTASSSSTSPWIIFNSASRCFAQFDVQSINADVYQLNIILAHDQDESRHEPEAKALLSEIHPASSNSRQSRTYRLQNDNNNNNNNSCDAAASAKTETSTTTISYRFSKTQAYLMLPSNHSWFLQHHLKTQVLEVSSQDPLCFGDPFWHWGIHYILGYDTIVWNWWVGVLSRQAPTSQTSGFVISERTGRLQELKLMFNTTTTEIHTSSPPWKRRMGFLFHTWWSKAMVLMKTTFLFFFMTTLISFTLRETQERMLEFTQELARRVQLHAPLVDLVVFHLIQNVVFVPIMVGMMFFLIEFYGGDRLLAFMVMTIVWCVEVFSVISLRSHQGITFFPRIFFLLFCLFHIYYFANPYGFAYLALCVVGGFMGHSMAFFWHRFELPAVAMRRVTLDRPRIHHHREHPPPPQPEEQPQQHAQDSIFQPFLGMPFSPRQPPPQPQQSQSTQQDPPLQSPPRIRSTYSSEHQPRGDFEPIMRQGQDDWDGTNVSRSTSLPQTSRQSRKLTSQTANAFRSDNDEEDDEEDNTIHNDEDSSSYVYFMQGEVVLHRQRPSHLQTNGNGIRPVESSHTLASTTSGRDVQSSSLLSGHGGWTGMDMEVEAVTASNSDPRTTDDWDGRPHTIVYTSHSRDESCDGEMKYQEQDENDEYDGEHQIIEQDEQHGTSSLQAILEVKLTPRHRNGEERCNSPPIFPRLTS